MKKEFQANYSLALKPGFVQQESIDYLLEKTGNPPKHWPEISEIKAPFSKLQLLSQAILSTYKDYARTGQRNDGGFISYIKAGMLKAFFEEQYNKYLKSLDLLPALPDIKTFPFATWAIEFKFKLNKPYISKDDTDFYIIDNPVKKEWVFKLPYIAASQWKGTLKSVMTRELKEKCGITEKKLQMSLIFGDEKENNSLPSHRGHLYFYPTYFTEIGLEVINPHPRDTGAGSSPIYFETVPAGAEGTFTLLYVPIDLIGNNKEEIKKQSFIDLKMVAKAINSMMTQYGFGAKTSSGFGLVEDNVKNGRLDFNIDCLNQNQSLDFQSFSELIEKTDAFKPVL